MPEDTTGPDEPDAAPSVELVQTSASAALMAASQFDNVWRMSKALAKSGSFKDIGQEEGPKALARILLGADLGMSPTQALMGIDIVKGNPQVRGVALGRMVRKSAKQPTPSGESYDYAVLDRGFTPGEEYAVVALYRRDDDGAWPWVEGESATFPTIVGTITIDTGQRLPEAVEAFKLDQAKKRNLIKTDGAWQSQPEVMVVWRALSQLVRFYAPDVIGGMPVYTEADGLREMQIGAGQGDGSEPGWRGLSVELAADAERMIQRAAELGHGLSDRATVQMRLNGKTETQVHAFLADAWGELNELAAKTADGSADEIAGGEYAAEGPPLSDALEARAADVGAQAQAASDAGDDDRAAELSAEQDALMQEAAALRAGQTTLDGV